MSFTITCPGCGQITSVRVAVPGEQVWCGGCGSMIDVSADSLSRTTAVTASVVLPKVPDEIRMRAIRTEERLRTASRRRRASHLFRLPPRSVRLALVAAGITLATQAFLSLAPFGWVSWSWFATGGAWLSTLRLARMGNWIVIGMELGIPAVVLAGWIPGLRWSWAVGRVGSILLAVLIPNLMVANLLQSANSTTTFWQLAGVAVLMTLHAVPLFIAFVALGSRPAREHFGLVCPSCGFISGGSGSFFRSRITCAACGERW